MHQLTALSGPMSVREARRPDRSSAAIMTNRLRTEATDHLLAAGRAVRGTARRRAELRRVPVRPHGRAGADRGRPARSHRPAGGVAHRPGGIPVSRTGGDDDRLGRGARVALRRLLRPGDLDQPGSRCADGGADPQASASRSSATVVASRRTSTSTTPRRRPRSPSSAAAPGVYYVVDDEPAPVREWLPVLASALDAGPPRRLPRWLGRLVAGPAATAMMTEARGASNEKARRELGWRPRYASWRQGFAQGLG